MSYEVELKFRVADPSRLREAIEGIGAAAGNPAVQEDRYLAHPGRDFAATGEALRLRRTGDRNAVTYKGPKQPGPTKTREEIEVPFEPGAAAMDAMTALFLRLGFRSVLVVRKTRTEFRLDSPGRGMTITLDDVDQLGSFAEVEALAVEEAELPAAQAAVLDLAARLGLDQVEPRSYLRMQLERGAGGNQAIAENGNTPPGAS